MTNPTLERAARALAACEQSDYEFGVMADHYIAMARAVLMAVRDDEGIADMVYAAESRAHIDWGKIWPEQIDAILGEGEGE